MDKIIEIANALDDVVSFEYIKSRLSVEVEDDVCDFCIGMVLSVLRKDVGKTLGMSLNPKLRPYDD